MSIKQSQSNGEHRTAFRTVTVFVLFCLCACFLVLRVLSIGRDAAAAGATNPAVRRITAAVRRAPIYDTNGVLLVNNNKFYAAAVVPSAENLAALRPVLSDEDYAKLKGAFTKNLPAVVALKNSVERQPGLLVSPVFSRYSENALARHVIGYTDVDGVGITGIERAYNNLLTNHGGSLIAAFPSDAKGNLLGGEPPYWEDNNYLGRAGLQLTIDKKIQNITENALDLGGITRGAAVVLDVKTGAIRAMVSRPNYDPNHVAAALDSRDAPLLNRAVRPFAVGSVFKPAIAAAALEAGISPDISFVCKGYMKIGDVTIHCWNNTAHGSQTLKEGIANSCNPFFIQLAQKMPPEVLLDMARAMGYGQSALLAPGMTSSAGQLPQEAALNELPAALANFSFGQGDFTATPLQIAAAFACIAADGQYHPPYLVEGLVDDDGRLYNETERGGPYSVLRKETAAFLQDALLYTVREGTAIKAKSEFIAACGKTGTAQTARYDADGNEYAAAWFAGFFPAWEPKYAVAIFKEDGRGGSADCAPVFKRISEELSRVG
ncbi:MAG: penicillin-binding protein 2 [Oscillospiraceae bacterium]|jgi:cell division protein FtsI/penicillin-binding protein 2|nr:penicillin-binding protein 2 [Oscillospiraceae bacterium]